jgi:hypothetical protein
MSRQPRNQGAAAAGTAATRQNEYFVPRDGIDREVISADICRYLGNDALVRPGHYENPQTGQVVQGYYITAYRNLTTAMIEDLKADSARWDSERRAQTSRSTAGVQYRYSETHQSRQHAGPTDNAYPSDPYARDTGYDGPRYPGTGAPGYTGASGGYPPQQQQQQAGYPAAGGGYGGFQQSQQSPPPDPRYASPAQAGSMYPGSQDSPYIATGANNHRSYAPPSDPYAASRIGASSAGAQQGIYATSAPPQSGYPASSFPSYPGQVPQQNATPYAQPHDPFYGRGQNTQNQQGYSAQAQQATQQQYEQSRASASAASTQQATSSTGSNARRSDRESETRHSGDRHHRAARR